MSVSRISKRLETSSCASLSSRGVTVTVHAAVLSPRCAVMVVSPTLRPVTTPLVSTVATFRSLEVQTMPVTAAPAGVVVTGRVKVLFSATEAFASAILSQGTPLTAISAAEAWLPTPVTHFSLTYRAVVLASNATVTQSLPASQLHAPSLALVQLPAAPGLVQSESDEER